MADFLVIGGGIAGASVGYFLSRAGRVVVLEMEEAPGRHATGRSAALFTEYYGNAVVRALTRASRSFFENPPPGFTDSELLTPRGTVALCPPGAEAAFEVMLAEGRQAPEPAHELSHTQVLDRCPLVRPDWFTRALLKPGTMDIDSAALHEGFLRGVRAAGGQVVVRARVRSLERRAGTWRARTDVGEFAPPVLVNAAGAWADEIARLAGLAPRGLVALRRTVFLTDPPAGVEVRGWPMINDVTDTFYLKPESGRLLISPADATPQPPADVRADDLDVARGAVRVEEATTLQVRSARPAWAGLRTFERDGSPVVGPDVDGFFWMAALGGYGLQMSPALGRVAAALALGEQPPTPDCVVSDISPKRALI